MKIKTPFTPSILNTSKEILAAPVASYATLMLPMIFARSAGGCSAEEMNRAPMAETILTFGLSALSREYTQVLNLPVNQFHRAQQPDGTRPENDRVQLTRVILEVAGQPLHQDARLLRGLLGHRQRF